MPRYIVWIDPRAEETRKQLRGLTIRDMETMRWAFHFSDEEMAYLERHNPDLGWGAGPREHDAAWARFYTHPDSKPYRVR